MSMPARCLAAPLVVVFLLGFPKLPQAVMAFDNCGPGISKTAIVSDFYDAINAGPSEPSEFRQAYACYSAAYQARTNYAAWLKGYATSMHTQVIEGPRLLANGAVAFTILATDARNGHRVFTQYTGTWTLVQQHGWRLDQASIHLSGQRDGPSLAFNDKLLASLVTNTFQSTMDLPAWLPFTAKGIAWEEGPIEGGITITLAQGAPVSDATTLFTESATKTFIPTAGVDGQVTLANHSRAYFYSPFNHGGNGQPQLQWSQNHQAYQITYACRSNCLANLTRIANSLAPFYDSWG